MKLIFLLNFTPYFFLKCNTFLNTVASTLPFELMLLIQMEMSPK